MLQVGNLYIFIIVVQRGGFSEAARHLKISTTAVSKNIKLLEAELGISLFHRSARGITLTDNAKPIYERARNILTGLDEIKNLASLLRKQPTGSLRISTPHSIASHLLLPHLQKFLETYPELTIDLTCEDHKVVDLDKDNIDILFGRTMETISSQEQILVAVKLIDVEVILCASTKYFKKFKMPSNLSQLSGHSYIYHKLRTRDKFIELCKENNVEINLKLLVSSTEELVQAVLRDIGIAICPRYIVEDRIKKKDIVVLDRIYKPEIIPIYMFYRKSQFNQAKIIQFKEFILNALTKV